MFAFLFVLGDTFFVLFSFSRPMPWLPCCKTKEVVEDAGVNPNRKKESPGKDFIPTEWLDFPTKKFRFLTSHNTYLTGLQFGPGSCDPDGVVQALQMGARCIELDVFCADFQGGDFAPVVAHGIAQEAGDIKVTGTKPFDEFIKMIKIHGWKNTTQPLFLMVEYNTCWSEE